MPALLALLNFSKRKIFLYKFLRKQGEQGGPTFEALSNASCQVTNTPGQTNLHALTGGPDDGDENGGPVCAPFNAETPGPHGATMALFIKGRLPNPAKALEGDEGVGGALEGGWVEKSSALISCVSADRQPG